MNFRTIITVAAIICLYTQIGCSGNVSDTSRDNSEIQFNVDGIEREEVTSGAPTLPNKSKKLNDSVKTGAAVRSKSASESVLKKDNRIKINTSMPIGTRFLILVYNKATGENWKTVHATAGTPVVLDVERGLTYSWYAYSYNTTEDLAIPHDIINPVIETSVEKDLLYASGEVNVSSSNKKAKSTIGIIFEHKVAQLRVRIDATELAKFAKINNLKAVFDQDHYIKKGIFTIKENKIDQLEVVPTQTIFNQSSASNVWERSYYTVDPAVLTKYKILITDLPVTFFESSTSKNLANHKGVANRPVFPSDFSNPAIGQRLLANVFLHYKTTP